MKTRIDLVKEKIAEIKTIIAKESKQEISEAKRKKLKDIQFDLARLDQSLQQYMETP